MSFEQTRLDRSLSRFELILAVAVIGILVTVFINRVLFMTAVAEARSLDLAVNDVRKGIMLFVAVQLIEGRYENISAAAVSNPVDKIIEPPVHYAGEFDVVSAKSVGFGNWAYEKSSGRLVYYVLNRDYLKLGDLNENEMGRLILDLVLHFTDSNGNGRYDEGIDRPEGLGLQILEQPNWRFKM